MSFHQSIARSRAVWRELRRAGCVALLLLASASGFADEPPEVHREADSIHYAGDLTVAGLARLEALYGDGATWLVIDSGGGEVNAAMDFGDWIFARRINVRVSDRCLSACANYVFTAAPVKVIEPGAIVAWHGSAVLPAAASRSAIDSVIERDILPGTAAPDRAAVRAKLMEDTLSYLHRTRERQARFFDKIGVDERITRVGLGHPAVRDFWFLSVESMQRFGVTRVVAPSDYPATDTRRFGSGAVVWLDVGADTDRADRD